MRIGSVRAIVLAVALAGIGTAMGAGGAAAAAQPSGFSVDCLSRVARTPAKADGMVMGDGNGRCTMTGDFAAPWYVRVTVRLQVRISGTWRTRALAVSWVEGNASTKRVWGPGAGYACQGSTARPWRIKLVTEALASEKVVVTLDKDVATSDTKVLSC